MVLWNRRKPSEEELAGYAAIGKAARLERATLQAARRGRTWPVDEEFLYHLEEERQRNWFISGMSAVAGLASVLLNKPWGYENSQFSELWFLAGFIAGPAGAALWSWAWSWTGRRRLRYALQRRLVGLGSAVAAAVLVVAPMALFDIGASHVGADRLFSAAIGLVTSAFIYVVALARNKFEDLFDYRYFERTQEQAANEPPEYKSL